MLLRSDTAGYQKELLRYCAEGRSERFGVIEFAVGVDVTPEFKESVREVEEDEWHDLYRTEGEGDKHTGQQYAEVCYVPNWIGHSKNTRLSLHSDQGASEEPIAAWNGVSA